MRGRHLPQPPAPAAAKDKRGHRRTPPARCHAIPNQRGACCRRSAYRRCSDTVPRRLRSFQKGGRGGWSILSTVWGGQGVHAGLPKHIQSTASGTASNFERERESTRLHGAQWLSGCSETGMRSRPAGRKAPQPQAAPALWLPPALGHAARKGPATPSGSRRRRRWLLLQMPLLHCCSC